MTTQSTSTFDLFSPAFSVDPYPTYRALREAAPVCRVTQPNGFDTWLITRYEDARAAFLDPRLSKDMRCAGEAYLAQFGESSAALDENMLNADPPNHTRLRRLVSQAFTSRRVEALRSRVQQITDDLLHALAAHGKADLIEEFAFPQPITVICELLGIPVNERDDMTQWTRSLGTFGQEEAAQAERHLHTYLVDLIARKRRQPEEDMLSALIAARDDESKLTESELISTAFLLLFAGHETTANLIGNAILALLLHPDQQQLLREQPPLLTSAVEEFLRYDGSVEQATFRFASEDIEIGGIVIPRGAQVTIILNAANRDAQKFAFPDSLDVTRAANHHLAFGHGIHYCLGAPLARMEVQIALQSLLQRFPDLALAVPPEDLEWLPAFVPFRGLRALPVTFTPC